MKLVVGLGNPGAEYAYHRHNVGFMVVNAVAAIAKAGTPKTKFNSLMWKYMSGGEDVILLQPQTYMNNSGQAVRAAADFFKLTVADIIVLHDELDIPLGNVRLKIGGGDAGHNGLKSITAHMGSADYQRVRIGIGHPGDKAKVHSHVLSNFSNAETEIVTPLINNIAAHLPKMWQEDATAFINALNINK